MGVVNKLLKTKSFNVLPLHLKQIFLPIIGIFTDGEGDMIESRLPFKSFSTLTQNPQYGQGHLSLNKVYVSGGLKRGISIEADFGPLRYVL